jgi:glycosyltransferase involved in cell wall biosynthesis
VRTTLPSSTLTAPPRVAVLGQPQSSLGAAVDGLAAAISSTCDVRSLPAPRGARGWLPALRRGSRAINRDGCELVHVVDPSLAPAALLLRARYGVPISVSLDGLREHKRPAPAPLGVIGRFDQVFTSDLDHARDLIVQLRGPAIAYTPPAAMPLSQPRERTLKQYERAFRRTSSGRLVVGLLWPSEREHLRWFRDAVAPLLHGEPVCLLIGAPSVGEARHVFGTRAMKHVLVRTSRITADEIAAAARFADVLAVPGAIRGVASQTQALLTLIASGVPLLAGGAVQDDVLEHERNALIVDPGDAMGLASTLNRLLILPAQQRHYLGQDFAAYTADKHAWDAAAALYAERFAALVGRPRIPLELKAVA